MQLRLSTRTAGGIMVVDCSGKLVFGEESAALRDLVKKLIEEKHNRLVLNLGDVHFGGFIHDCTEHRWGAEVGAIDAARR